MTSTPETLPPISAQAQTLIDLGVHELAGLSAADLRTAASALASGDDRVAPSGGDGPAVLAVNPDIAPASALAPLLRRKDKPGFVVVDMADVDSFSPIESIAIPPGPLYLLHGPDRGDEMANWSPTEALPEITAAGRSPLLLTEGIAWLLQQPDVLARNKCFMTIGSRLRRPDGTVDARTPAIWISGGTGRDGAANRNAPKGGLVLGAEPAHLAGFRILRGSRVTSSPGPLADPHAIVARLRAAGCVFAEQEAALLIGSGATGAELDTLVAERESGRPLEYVLGWAEFAGLRIPVTDGVFVPRRRTESLARAAVEVARAHLRRTGRDGPSPVVVDLCCGAGALGAAIARAVPGVELHGADIDPAAVACACAAVAPFGARVYAGDLYGPLPRALRGRVDVLVVNAPYVPTDEIDLMPAEARDFERRAALDGGPDGLAVLGRAVAAAADWLSPAGSMLTECAEHQARALAGLMRAAGLVAGIHRDDDWDATMVIGQAPKH